MNTQNTARRILTPIVDAIENDNGLVLFADVPGVDLEDVALDLDQGVLTLSAKRHIDEEAFDEYRRRFQVPKSTDPEAVSAALERGVLQVTLPKAESYKPRRIEVTVG